MNNAHTPPASQRKKILDDLEKMMESIHVDSLHQLSERLRPYHLTIAQYLALAYVANQDEPSTLSEIGAHIGAPPSSMTSIVDRMETMIWCIAPAGEPADLRAARLRKFEDFFLPSGMATPDDVAVAEAAQRASHALDNRWTLMGRGIAFKTDGPDQAARELGMAPAVSSTSWDHEIAMQGVYRRWLQMMERGEERRRD